MAGKPKYRIPDLGLLAARYAAGESVADIAKGRDFTHHTLRRRFVEMGIMRGNVDAVKLAFASGKMNNRKTRAGVPQPMEARRKQSRAMRRKADATARGYRISSQGYVELTRKGQGEGRRVHVMMIEERIGRRLLPDECVHHIDGDKLNNTIENLALMTRAAHARLHRREDEIAGNLRERTANGQFK